MAKVDIVNKLNVSMTSPAHLISLIAIKMSFLVWNAMIMTTVPMDATLALILVTQVSYLKNTLIFYHNKTAI